MSGVLSLGRFSRGQKASRDFGIYGFAGGINVKDVGQQVGDNDLTLGLNGYLRPGGGFASRMGMTLFSALGIGPVSGIFRFYQGVVGGTTTSVARTLEQIGNSLYWKEFNSVIGTIGTAAQPMTVVQIQNPNDPNFPGGLTDVAIICTGSGGPYVYDGTNLYVPAGWSGASGAQWVAVVNGIAWFGGIKGSPNQIFGTGNGQIGDFSFETLPAIRNFRLSGPVSGLCAMGTGAQAVLAIGRNNGITVLSGTGITNFYEQDIPMSDGVAAGRSMAAGPTGELYFLGNQAVYVLQGLGSPSPISYKIEPWVLNDLLIPGYPISARSSAWGCVYNNRYHLGYFSGFYSGFGTIPPANTVLVYDISLGGWTVLQTTPGLACMALMNAPTDPQPWTALVGSASSNQAYNWDVEPLLGNTATDNGVAFTVDVQTKFFKLGEPGANKAMRRLYPEFFTCGTLNVNITVATDYGPPVSTSEQLFQVTTNEALWDVAKWDQALWAPPPAFLPIVAPQTRVDYDGVSGDSFAFGVTATVPNPPWILGGFTGTVHQRGRV